jgi:hypothetical protein
VVLTREGHVWSWGQPWPPGDMYSFLDLTVNYVFRYPCFLSMLHALEVYLYL